MTDSDHDDHCRHVSLRAVLQLWSDKHSLQLSRRKRRPVRRRRQENIADVEAENDDNKERNVGDRETVESFICRLAESYDLSGVDWDYGAELRVLYAENKKLFGLTEVLTGLQFLLQEVIENVLLVDRMMFLEEEGGMVSQVWEIFDAALSPRNKMLVAYRT